MAGSGRSEDTKNCGKFVGIIYVFLFFLMSLTLIGLSVRVCEKVTIIMFNMENRKTTV